MEQYSGNKISPKTEQIAAKGHVDATLKKLQELQVKAQATQLMHRRERIATSAMQALLMTIETDEKVASNVRSNVAQESVFMADALIAELDKDSKQ